MTSLLVASIDFGTTYSGWAFSFRHEFERDPIKISAKQWIGGQLVSQKGPTCVLIKPDGQTLESFGYEAENKYSELTAEDEHRQWYFFRRFKMLLFGRVGVERNFLIEDVNARKLPASRVFLLSIKYLKDDLLKMSKDRIIGGGLTDRDITWVLTVPAIWNDAAKQFMREAAENAGIPRNKLILALEPEAASLYCRHLPVEKCIGDSKVSLAKFQTGTKYLVLDAGGGTVDITVHEVMSNGNLKEIHAASGGAWGGTKVDDAYEKFLIDIMGATVVTTFKANFMEDFTELFRDFEIKKREIAPSKNTAITVRIPASLSDTLREETEKSIKEQISSSKYKDKIKIVSDKIRIDADIVKEFFNVSVKSVLDHITGLLKDLQSNCDAILMVGGFSESPLLQENIRLKFPNMQIIIPEDAGLAVLKGAVIFGHNPTTIAERVCKFTYGMSTTHQKRATCKHAQSRCEIDDNGELRCYDIFKIYAKIGQKVKLGEEQEEHVCNPLYDEQTRICYNIYASSSTDPHLVTERGCTKIGTFFIRIPDTSLGRNRHYGVRFIFGGTEITVKVVDKTSGEVFVKSVDFLG